MTALVDCFATQTEQFRNDPSSSKICKLAVDIKSKSFELNTVGDDVGGGGGGGGTPLVGGGVGVVAFFGVVVVDAGGGGGTSATVGVDVVVDVDVDDVDDVVVDAGAGGGGDTTKRWFSRPGIVSPSLSFKAPFSPLNNSFVMQDKVYGGNAFKPSYCCSFSNHITQAVTAQADVMTSFERKSLHRRHEPSGSCNLKDKEMLEYKDRGF